MFVVKASSGVVLLVFVIVLAVPACANLVPTSFGFPVIVQNGSSSAFNQDVASATDFEDLSIDFPLFADGVAFGPTQLDACAASVPAAAGSFNVLPFGPVNLAMPSISQTVLQTQNVSHTDFAQTSEFAAFAYPFEGIGGAMLPAFNFGW